MMFRTFNQMRALLGTAAFVGLNACAADVADEHDDPDIGSTEAALELPWEPSTFTPFFFHSKVSKSGDYADGDVRLDAIEYGHVKLPRWALQTVKRARILVDDG